MRLEQEIWFNLIWCCRYKKARDNKNNNMRLSWFTIYALTPQFITHCTPSSPYRMIECTTFTIPPEGVFVIIISLGIILGHCFLLLVVNSCCCCCCVLLFIVYYCRSSSEKKLGRRQSSLYLFSEWIKYLPPPPEYFRMDIPQYIIDTIWRTSLYINSLTLVVTNKWQ